MPASKLQRTINSDQRQKPKVVGVDAAYTALPQDSYIIVSSTADSVKVITLPNVPFVTSITIRMTARVAGSYTAVVTGGTLTLNAAGESAIVISDPTTGTATWAVASVFNATVV